MKNVSNERKRIQNFEAGLKHTGNRVDEVLAEVINSSTSDGRTIGLGSLDSEISSEELYHELVDMGILSRTEKEIITIQYTYKANDIYKEHFSSNGTGVKLKAQSLLLVDTLFLDKARANIKSDKGN